MQEITIQAHGIYFEFENDIASVSFQTEHERQYVSLSRQLYPTAHDRELGVDKIYVEVDDQINSAYGGIAKAEFYPAKLELMFANPTGKSLGISHVTVLIDTIPERFAQLKRVILTIFEKHRGFGTIASRKRRSVIQTAPIHKTRKRRDTE